MDPKCPNLTLKDGTYKTSMRRKALSKVIVLVDFIGVVAHVGNPIGDEEDIDVFVK